MVNAIAYIVCSPQYTNTSIIDTLYEEYDISHISPIVYKAQIQQLILFMIKNLIKTEILNTVNPANTNDYMNYTGKLVLMEKPICIYMQKTLENSSRSIWCCLLLNTEREGLGNRIFKYLNANMTLSKLTTLINESDIQIDRIRSKLDDTINIMHLNITQILERGEKLDVLVSKSVELSNSTKQFYKKAKKLNRCCNLL